MLRLDDANAVSLHDEVNLSKREQARLLKDFQWNSDPPLGRDSYNAHLG